MTVILVLPTGVIVTDPEWHTVADVTGSFHAFGVRRVYGQVQTEEGVALTHMAPFPAVDGWGV